MPLPDTIPTEKAQLTSKMSPTDSFRQLGGDLKGLVNHKEFSDVIFVFKDASQEGEQKEQESRKTIVYGHKCIIAQRSKHFRDLLSR